MQFSIIATLTLAAITSASTQSQKIDNFDAKKYHEQSNCNLECIDNSPEYINIIQNNGTEKGDLANVYKNCRAKCGLTKESYPEIKQPYRFKPEDINKNLNDTCNKFQSNSKQSGNFDLFKHIGPENINDRNKIVEAHKKIIGQSNIVQLDSAKSKCEKECFDKTEKTFAGEKTREERLSGLENYSKLVEDCVKKC